MEDDLGRMRVLAGRLGCPPSLWSHLDPDIERARLIEYCHSVLDELGKRKMPLEDYLEIVDRRDGIDDDRVIRMPLR